MSIHVCKCVHVGREEWHLRYPGMTEAEAGELADRINGGDLGSAARARSEEREACAKVCEHIGDTTVEFPEMAVYCADAIRMRSNARSEARPARGTSRSTDELEVFNTENR